MVLERKNISDITAYVGGKPIEETKRELGLKEVIKLASNENPLGPSPYAIKAIKKALSGINRYPDSNGSLLKEDIANFLKIKNDNVVLGNGSDELIDIIIKTFVEDNETIITSDSTFLEYAIISRVNNKKLICVPLKAFKYDLVSIKKAITKETKIVFIANPNNPTGTYVGKQELEEFLKDLPKNLIVVLDEAYDAYIDVNDYVSGLNYFKNNNVIVLKTFSKCYGLAGLRIGYAVCRLEFAKSMEKTRQPFNTNLLAQVGASAALKDKTFRNNSRKLNLEGKTFLYKSLTDLGVAFVSTVTNFILLDTKQDGVLVFKEMLKLGVIVRDMKQYGLDNFIRVTIGTKKENKKFIKALKKVLKY